MAFIALGGHYSGAQEVNNITITGKVSNSDGEVLPGVNIVLEETNQGTTTDMNGDYSLVVPESSTWLVFSFIGYTNEKIPIEGRSRIDVVMIPDLINLSEIVVVGYGTQKKSLVTGSISKITSDDITLTQDLRVEQALQGKVSGVIVQSNSGQPGQNLNVLIRGIGSNGNTEPLYIIAVSYTHLTLPTKRIV